jgi:hypothetical protein
MWSVRSAGYVKSGVTCVTPGDLGRGHNFVYNSRALREGSVREQQGQHMKKNHFALTVYAHAIKAANDDRIDEPVVKAPGSTTRPIRESSGWDPYEVWRTRIRFAPERASRVKR